MLASSSVNSSPSSGVANTLAAAPNFHHALTSPHHTSIKLMLSKQDREALLQYTKHFIRKAVQIIVQSRLGEKKPTKSRVYSYNTDWFNLSIKDLAQIATLVKSSLGNVENFFSSELNQPFCVEISLRTPENQTMILETWCILFNEKAHEPAQKVCYQVYKKMSLVLRSLLCVTRSIPTYQLSRRQNSDTYVLLYRLYCGEPIVHHLGENYMTAKVGTVGTPVGSLIVNVAYRTRLTMTPQNSYTNEYSGGIQIKDDHFVHMHSNEASTKSGKRTEADKSPRTNPSGQSLDQTPAYKRSSSNLNTIAESGSQLRQSSKAQPIPMKSSSVSSQNVLSNNNNQTNADDLNNSGSVASTPDTIYYFKLKSAAFVPSSTSFTSNNNNFYSSSSFGNLTNNSSENNCSSSINDLPPAFVTLLSNDFERNSSTRSHNASHSDATSRAGGAQSPSPPNNLQIDMRNRQLRCNQNLIDDQAAVSPCSLPNFKLLDHNMMNNRQVSAPSDDFVFIESIAFGLSNAADDLRTFFRACENAPMLDSFQNEPPLNEILKDLDQQLLSYESKVGEFDDLIKSLENN